MSGCDVISYYDRVVGQGAFAYLIEHICMEDRSIGSLKTFPSQFINRCDEY